MIHKQLTISLSIIAFALLPSGAEELYPVRAIPTNSPQFDRIHQTIAAKQAQKAKTITIKTRNHFGAGLYLVEQRSRETFSEEIAAITGNTQPRETVEYFALDLIMENGECRGVIALCIAAAVASFVIPG